MSFLEAVFSENTLVAIFRMATPLIFIAMAACIGRKANITSIAYEGMALLLPCAALWAAIIPTPCGWARSSALPLVCSSP